MHRYEHVLNKQYLRKNTKFNFLYRTDKFKHMKQIKTFFSKTSFTFKKKNLTAF